MKHLIAISALTMMAACSSGGLITPDGSPYAPPSRGETTVPEIEIGHRLMAAGQYELALRSFTRAAGDGAFEDCCTPASAAVIAPMSPVRSAEARMP